MPQLTNGNGLRKPRTASPVVRQICFLIRAHYDQRISVDTLAARIRRNAPYAAALFRRQTGMTIHDAPAAVVSQHERVLSTEHAD